MADASMGLHEKEENLDPDLIDRHRAIVSIMEELEAVDWYDQRAAATADPELKALLEHNRDEEKEHAAMVLEWLRRHDPGMDEQLRTYLYAQGPIMEIEEGGEHGSDAGAAAGRDVSLNIGSLRAI